VPNLIIDKDHDSDDEDDGFISKEDDHDQPPPDLHEMASKVDEEDGEHGMFMLMLLNSFVLIQWLTRLARFTFILSDLYQ